MVEYGVTDNGFVRKPFEVIRSEVEEHISAYVEAELDFSDDSELTQICVGNMVQTSELWGVAEDAYQSAYRDSANGYNLGQVVSLTGTTQSDFSKTTVQGRVEMEPNYSLPAGSVAHLQFKPNTRFITVAEVPSDPVGGWFDVDFIAEEFGPTEVSPNELNVIAEPAPGWLSVDNLAAGVTGSEPETDDELRQKQQDELEASGGTNLDAVRAAVRKLPGVTDVGATENLKPYFFNGMKPRSFRIVVSGGTPEDIARAIFTSKASGMDTNGSIVNLVTDSQGEQQEIRHDQATGLAFYSTATLEVYSTWDDATDLPDVKERQKAYIDSLGAGADVIYQKVSAAILENENVRDIQLLTINFFGGLPGTSNLSVNFDEVAEADTGNMTVNTNPATET